MSKILLATQQRTRPDGPVSNNDHNLIGSLYSSNVCDFSVAYRDEYTNKFKKKADGFVFDECIANGCDIVVLDYMHDGNNPSEETIERIRSNNIKTVCLWFDTKILDAREWTLFNKEYSNNFDLNIVFDSIVHENDKIMNMFVPQDSRIYHDAELPRGISLCFVGDTTRGKKRMKMLKHVINANIEKCHIQHTEQHEFNRLSPQDYAKIFQTSKIGLNVCGGQMKSRAYEIMHCGAALLSDSHEILDKLFVPMVDYIRYDNRQDMIEKIMYFLNNEDELLKITKCGHSKVLKTCNSTIFWQTIINKVNR